MTKLDLQKFTVESDDFCISFKDTKSEVFLDLEDLHKLRAFLDGLDDYYNNKKYFDPMDLPDNDINDDLDL